MMTQQTERRPRAGRAVGWIVGHCHGRSICVALLLAPLLTLTCLGVLQFCAMLATGQSLREAARRGAAEAVLPKATHETVSTAVRNALGDRPWGGQIDLVLIEVDGRTVLPGEAVDGSQGEVVTVSLSVAAADAAPDVLGFVGLSLGHRRLRAHSVSRSR